MSQDLINSIAHTYEGEEVLGAIGDYKNMSDKDKAGLLEDYLTTVCDSLAEVEKITGGVNVNAEYLLSIVASYLIGIQEGTLDIDTTMGPNVLFEENLYPTLANMEDIDVQHIEEGEDIGYSTDITNDEGHAAEDTTDE